MHILRSEGRSLDDAVAAIDLEQSAGDIVVLSFSDSDLGALSAAAELRSNPHTLRLANLARLKHPYSVDLYAERVVAHARFVLVRLLGGVDYWRYGVEELSRLARANGCTLAFVPGEHREDPRLIQASTLPVSDLRRISAWFRGGGTGNMGSLFGWVDTFLGRPMPWSEPCEVPPAGRYRPACRAMPDPKGRATITFYRSMVLAGDCAPITALADALAERGFSVDALYCTSLKDPGAATLLAHQLDEAQPDVIINTTAFSGRGDSHPSVLDRADVPVLQAIMAGSSEQVWCDNARGLGPADLAMNVVLPEMDGRLITAAISAKAEMPRSPQTEFRRMLHRPIASRVTFVAELAANWTRLRRAPAFERRVAMVLSDYPGKLGREAYAVGLDTPFSVAAVCSELRVAGYDIGLLPDKLMASLKLDPGSAEKASLSIEDYETLFSELPDAFAASVSVAWGAAADDAAVSEGNFRFRILQVGKFVLALQPDRGARVNRKTDYHDAARPPCHAYVAFYLWLRHRFGAHAIIHFGTHGTLEWTPGKPVALSPACAPEALLGPTPLIYPFIVNNPGEAAQAKRRNAAVTIGHMTPPLVDAGSHGAALELESLCDEYAAAETLDPRRAAIVARTLADRAVETGLAAEAKIDVNGGRSALAALDAWLCDVKDMRIRDGLHVFGQSPGELDGLCAALDGRYVPGGPAGAPSRGRLDVLPTGRNLYGTDPRAVPSRTAYEIGCRAAAGIAERYAQDHGEWPRAIVLDLWASATMRTAGEDFAQALAHLGVKPLWDHATARVNGFEILPYARLERPRIDVTLHISGLFRDIFTSQIAFFDQAARAIAALDEEDEINPLAALRRAGHARHARVFGAEPQRYGIGLDQSLVADPMVSREALGRAYLAAASHSYGGAAAEGVQELGSFSERVAAADAFVHVSDMADLDTLDSAATVEAEGGFAAAAEVLGVAPTLYHLDASRADSLTVRTQGEEISRVVRGRAANPRWIAGQMRHGFRGAAEIADTVDNLYAMAVMSDAVTSRHFDMLFAAVCGVPDVRAFLLEENRDAARAVAQRFSDASTRGLWNSRRNSDAAILADFKDAAA